MSYSSLITENRNGILIITINRPDKLNALNRLVMHELDAIVNEVYTDSTVKSAIFTGSGSKAFVAGADISEFHELNSEQGMAVSKKGHGIFSRIENSPKPIVAAINGFALGGGCELAMACHFRLCSDNAKFGQPEVNLGLIPGYGGTQRLTRLVGMGKALELMLSGDLIDAAEALRLGLVNYVTSQQDLLSKTIEILDKIQAKAPLSIAKVIECVNVAVTPAGNSGFEKEQNAFGECFGTDDMKEGVAAFLEKRKPVFSGK